MEKTGLYLQKQYLNVGDQISIQAERLTMAPLRGKRGTVTAVFAVPRGSCMVRLEGDEATQRELFLYRNEMLPSSRHEQ